MKRFSPQRQAVYDAVLSTKSHPTADWVYETVRKTIPKISLGTVYRDLSDLKREGKIIGFSDENGIEHFDGWTENHAHFKCTQCGRLIDICDLSTKEIDSKAEETSGCEINRAVLLYFGKCNECKNKNTENINN